MMAPPHDLRERMAEHGFESNDDYVFPIRCLLESPTTALRALNIEGDSDRRKTAFATALAGALGWHVLYHDFSEQSPPLPEVILPPSRDELGREEPPIDRLDQVVSEACAYSEGVTTALILDQLQMADFREHLRLHRLICDRSWTFRGARFYANASNLLVLLISEEPLFHSLQRVSFRVWVGRASARQIDYQPSDFGLAETARPLFAALRELFQHLGTGPTRSELARVLHAIAHQVRGADDLVHGLYGWTEGLDRQRLLEPATRPLLERVVESALTWQDQEVIGIGPLEER